jgi:endonuclease/exonuclease/phosphatase family metal-dependent hydrolase
MLSENARRRMKAVWMILAFAMFAARFGQGAKTYMKQVFGVSLGDEATSTAGKKSAPDADPSEAGFAPQHDPSRTLRLSSWNLEFLDEPGKGEKPRTGADYAALRRYAARLDADVVAVQEVASEAALAEVFPPEVFGYHLAERGGVQRSGFVYRRGLSIQELPDVDGLALRDLRAGAQLAVSVAGHTVRLLSVHLKAHCMTEALTTPTADCDKLRAQLPALEAWMEERAAEGVPFAVMGDFNRMLGAPDDEVYRELDDGEPSALQLKRGSTRTQSRCRGGRVGNVIDHMLLGGSAGKAALDPGVVEVSYTPSDMSSGVQLSDHCPITLALNPKSL